MTEGRVIGEGVGVCPITGRGGSPETSEAIDSHYLVSSSVWLEIVTIPGARLLISFRLSRSACVDRACHGQFRHQAGEDYPEIGWG